MDVCLRPYYARWLPIYIRDLERLPLDLALYQHFTDGHFTVKKTERNFSNIATDQAHEQNNKLVKISGGAVCILDSPAALLKWSIAGPEIKHMLESLDGSLDYTDFVDDEDNENGLHHEDTKVFENRFRDDVNTFFEELNSRGNPFLLLGDELENIFSKSVMSLECSKSVRDAYSIGKEAYEKYCAERLVSGTASIYDTIKMNKLPLFRQKNIVRTPKTKLQILSLKADCQLFSS